MDNNQTHYLGPPVIPKTPIASQLAFLVIDDAFDIRPELESAVQFIKASKYYSRNCIVSHVSSAHVAFCRRHGVRSAKRSDFLAGNHEVIKHAIEKYLQGMKTLVVVIPNAKLTAGRIDSALEVGAAYNAFEIDLNAEGVFVMDIDNAIKTYYGEPKEEKKA